MDNTTFNFVSAVAAIGGLVGTGMGYMKLRDERELQKVKALRDVQVIDNASDRVVDGTNALTGSHVQHRHIPDKTVSTMVYLNDFARTVGYLGIHSMFGMMVPLAPMYFVGSIYKRNVDDKKERQ